MARPKKISLPIAAAAAELAELGFPPAQIPPMLGGKISTTTVRDIIHKHGRWGEVSERPVFARLRAEQNKVLESAFRAGSAQLLERAFEEEKLKKASTYQLVIASSVALDKSRLLAGEPTELIGMAHLHEVPALDRLAAALSSRLVPIQNDVSRETIEIKPQENQGVKT